MRRIDPGVDDPDPRTQPTGTWLGVPTHGFAGRPRAPIGSRGRGERRIHGDNASWSSRAERPDDRGDVEIVGNPEMMHDHAEMRQADHVKAPQAQTLGGARH